MQSWLSKNILMLLALAYPGSTYAAADKAVDLYLLGLASPVGVVGLTYTEVSDESLGWQLGFGEGGTGKHICTQMVYKNAPGERGWSSSGAMGLSYAAGAEDRKGHSEDFLWLNLSWQLTFHGSSGWRYGLELGVTTIVAEALFRTNSYKKDELDKHMMGGLDPRDGGFNVGKTLPQISLVKLGYEW